MARAFETSLARLLPQLSEAGQQQDLATVAHVAHTLKSSSASIGALKLSQMCADLESIIRRQTGEDLSSRIRDIPLEAERVQGRVATRAGDTGMTRGNPMIDEEDQEQPKVLLVDDDEVTLLLTSIALRERGFAVTEATSGERALRLLGDWLPDVVVLDAVMPGLDGFATCRNCATCRVMSRSPS